MQLRPAQYDNSISLTRDPVEMRPRAVLGRSKLDRLRGCVDVDFGLALRSGTAMTTHCGQDKGLSAGFLYRSAMPANNGTNPPISRLPAVMPMRVPG